MASPDKETIGAERLESPERFVRNSLVGFSGNDCRDAPQGARAGGAGGTEKEGAACCAPTRSKISMSESPVPRAASPERVAENGLRLIDDWISLQ